MRETYMHVAGVVVTDPLVRKFDDGRRVMSFRVASTSRRYDNNSKDWVDGQTLWLKVSCWRELAENAAECVRKGDRIVVWGRVRTEQWKGEDGGQRSDLAVEAEALGHDLAFGVATFVRRRRAVSTQTLTAEGVVDTATGELTAVPAPGVPAVRAEFGGGSSRRRVGACAHRICPRGRRDGRRTRRPGRRGGRDGRAGPGGDAAGVRVRPRLDALPPQVGALAAAGVSRAAALGAGRSGCVADARCRPRRGSGLGRARRCRVR